MARYGQGVWCFSLRGVSDKVVPDSMSTKRHTAQHDILGIPCGIGSACARPGPRRTPQPGSGSWQLMRSLIFALALLAPIAASPAHAYGKHARMVGIRACRLLCNESCYGGSYGVRCSYATSRRAAKACKSGCPDLFT